MMSSRPTLVSSHVQELSPMKLRAVLAVLIFSLISAFSSVTFAQSPNIVELQRDWKLISADKVAGDDALVSQPNFDASQWYPVPHMPATVLQILEDDGVYKDLYFGTNLTKPGELWRQDWWYRTTFMAPAGSAVNTLIFKGINYRADIWLNGHKIARRDQAV